MKSSEDCLSLIKEAEGCRLSPYLCPAGKATIGFGSTRYEDGTAVTMDDQDITEERANDLLCITLTTYEDAVNQMVQVDLTQGQYDALVDFAYNAGVGALHSSTLMRLLNAGDVDGASLEFAKWVHGGGRVLPGLVKRRRAEYELFTKDM